MYHLTDSKCYTVVQVTGIRNVTVYALFKCHAFLSAKVIALPVAGTITAFSPVFFYVVTVNNQFVCRAFIKACKVAAQHDKICTHSKCQCNVIVVNNSAVRTDRNINTGFCVVFITGFCNFNGSSSLSASNTFLFTGDTDRTAANTNLNKVSTVFCKEHKSVAVNNVTGTNFYILAEFFVDVVQCACLPFTVAFT